MTTTHAAAMDRIVALTEQVREAEKLRAALTVTLDILECTISDLMYKDHARAIDLARATVEAGRKLLK